MTDKYNDFFKRSNSYTRRVPCSILLLHQASSLAPSWESYSWLVCTNCTSLKPS